MQASSMTAYPGTLPPGWTAHLDHQRNMWYYVNLNTMPPQVSLVHPDDQSRGLQAPSVQRARRDTAPSEIVSHHQYAPGRTVDSSNSTPFAAAVEAQNAKQPTFAQQLYASSLPASWPSPPRSDEDGDKASYGFSNLDAPWRSPSPQEDLTTIATQTIYTTPPLSPMPIPSLTFSASSNSTSTPASSPPPFSSSLPEWIPPRISPAPSRRPRGARSSSFGTRAVSPGFTLPPVDEGVADGPKDVNSLGVPNPDLAPQLSYSTGNTSADILSVASASISVYSPSPPPPPAFPAAPPAQTAPLSYIPPTRPVRTRHTRAATFPNIVSMNSTSAYSLTSTQTSSQMSKPKETPVYALVARSPDSAPGSTISTPAFQKSNNIPSFSSAVQPTVTRPVLPALIIPNSTGTGLPMGAAIPYNNNNNNNMPNMNTPPTQFFIPANAKNDLRSIMAQGGIPNQATNPPNPTQGNHEVMKQVGIAVGKSAGKAALRLGTKVLLGNLGISSDNDTGDVISAGLTNVVASAATAAASAAFKASTNHPTTTQAAVPPSNNLTPDYVAILAQMQSGQQFGQQIMPQQTGLNQSDIQMANMMAQMQMMQLQQQQFRPPTQIPFGNMAPQITGQTHLLSHQQRPQWQQSLVNNVIGGTTHALVSGAMSNFDFPATMDSDNAVSSFTDFASFDASN